MPDNHNQQAKYLKYFDFSFLKENFKLPCCEPDSFRYILLHIILKGEVRMKRNGSSARARRAKYNPVSRLLGPKDQGQDALLAYPFHHISPHLEVKFSPRAKRMALRLDPKTRAVNLVVPKRTGLDSAYRFAFENRQWIQDKIEELPEHIPFEDGAILPIFGKNRRIVIFYRDDIRYTDIHLKNNELLVITNREDPSARIKRYLIELVRNEIDMLAHEKSALIRRRIQSIQVRDTKSRWGSCSEDGRLSFCWRLIFAPYEALDYVVAHEVAHLSHMNHSQRFWDLCADLSEDYDEGYAWMKAHGHELMRYGC